VPGLVAVAYCEFVNAENKPAPANWFVHGLFA
jgi:hypothetical protein